LISLSLSAIIDIEYIRRGEKEMITFIRRKDFFIMVSLIMALLISAISSVSEEALASMMASVPSSFNAENVSQSDMAKIEAVLESRLVLQKLQDFGMSSAEAMAKVRQLDSGDLHTLASIVHAPPAGGDGFGILIGAAVLAILVIIILKLLNKEIIIK
jgi:hypothetical protein